MRRGARLAPSLLLILAAGCGGLFGSTKPGAAPSPAVARDTAPATRVVTRPTQDATTPPAPSGTSTSPGSSRPAPSPANGAASATIKPADFAATLTSRKQTLIAAGRRVTREEVGYYMDVQEARLRQVGGADLRVVRREESVDLGIEGPIAFEVSSAKPTSRAIAVLTSVAKVLVDYRFSVISVHGHTDDSGDAAQNLALSEQRALAVARQLVADGVTADRILVVGHGATVPLVPNTTLVGREQNRRIEITVEPLVP